MRFRYFKIKSLFLSKLFKNCESAHFGKIVELKGAENISIGNNSVFGDYLYLTAWKEYKYFNDSNEITIQRFTPTLSIGANCVFGSYNHISCINEITIGDNILTGKWVTIVDNSHGDTDIKSLKIPPKFRKLISKGGVKIGDNVWIGDKATILPNVTIGDGAVIAANSVVTCNVPAYCVIAGAPAKIIKHYN